VSRWDGLNIRPLFEQAHGLQPVGFWIDRVLLDRSSFAAMDFCSNRVLQGSSCGTIELWGMEFWIDRVLVFHFRFAAGCQYDEREPSPLMQITPTTSTAATNSSHSPRLIRSTYRKKSSKNCHMERSLDQFPKVAASADLGSGHRRKVPWTQQF
jgi:hypothetical protein